MRSYPDLLVQHFAPNVAAVVQSLGALVGRAAALVVQQLGHSLVRPRHQWLGTELVSVMLGLLSDVALGGTTTPLLSDPTEGRCWSATWMIRR